jgi:hypothetical protein
MSRVSCQMISGEWEAWAVEDVCGPEPNRGRSSGSTAAGGAQGVLKPMAK